MRNVARYGATLVAGVLLALIVGGCTPAAKKARHLRRGNQYYSAGQFDQAEIEYLIVLKSDPANAEAIGRLGIIYSDEGRYGRAIPCLLKARELSPNNLELRLKLATIYLVAGKTKEARDEINYVLDRRATDDEAPLLLVEAVGSTNAIPEIEQQLQALIQKNGETAPLQVALGNLEMRRGNLKAAEVDLERARTLDPKSSAVFWGFGNLYAMQNDLKQAGESFKAACELAPLRSPRRLRYAQFKIQTGDLAGAKQLLEEVVQKTPDYLPAWRWMAEIALNEKNHDQCADMVGKILARDPLNYDALLLNGRLMLAKAEPDKAVVEFKKVVTAYPQAASAHYQLAVGYMAENDVADAVTSLNQTLSLAPDLGEAIVLLAGIKMKTGDLDTAIVSLKQLVDKHPHYVQAQFLLADAYRAKGNLDGAVETYREVGKQLPKSPDAPLLMGMVLLQQSKRDEARQAFSKALELSPDYLPAVEQLVDMDLADKQYATALQRAQTEVVKSPKSTEPLLLQAKVLLAQHDTKQAEAILLKAIGLQPESHTAYMMLARLYMETKQTQKALDNLRELVKRAPKDTGALMLIGMMQHEQKDYAAARDTYENLLSINPKFTPALNNLAWLYAEQFGQIDKAYELASKARELLPYDAATADTLGWILYKKKQYTRAVSLLQESAGKLVNDPDVQFHVGMARYMLGQEEPAQAALQRALGLNKEFSGKGEAAQCLAVLSVDPKTAKTEGRVVLEKRATEKPDDPVALMRLASLDEQEGKFDKAAEAYQAAANANPESVGALLNLTRLYSGHFKDVPKAMELAKAAYKLAPDDPNVSAALGRLAYQTGDFKWASSLLQQASSQRPQDAELLYDMALASYSMGKIPDAEAAARTALQAGSGFSRADDATRFLEMIALASEPTRAVAAASHIDDILKSDPGYVPALMVVATIDEQKPDSGAAVKLYEKVIGLYPDFGPAKRRLAILYAAGQPGDNQKASDVAMQARVAFPTDPGVAKALGIIEYRQGDYARAIDLLQESARKLDRDAPLMYYLGMAQYRNNQHPESKRSLQRALDLSLPNDLAESAKKTMTELK